MTGAKKLIDANLIETGRINTHRKWPFEDTISVFWGKFRRPLAALDRCTLNKGAFAFKTVRGALKWPLKGGSRLIEVAATAGLTVFGLLFGWPLKTGFTVMASIFFQQYVT